MATAHTPCSCGRSARAPTRRAGRGCRPGRASSQSSPDIVAVRLVAADLVREVRGDEVVHRVVAHRRRSREGGQRHVPVDGECLHVGAPARDVLEGGCVGTGARELGAGVHRRRERLRSRAAGRRPGWSPGRAGPTRQASSSSSPRPRPRGAPARRAFARPPGAGRRRSGRRPPRRRRRAAGCARRSQAWRCWAGPSRRRDRAAPRRPAARTRRRRAARGCPRRRRPGRPSRRGPSESSTAASASGVRTGTSGARRPRRPRRCGRPRRRVGRRRRPRRHARRR